MSSALESGHVASLKLNDSDSKRPTIAGNHVRSVRVIRSSTTSTGVPPPDAAAAAGGPAPVELGAGSVPGNVSPSKAYPTFVSGETLLQEERRRRKAADEAEHEEMLRQEQVQADLERALAAEAAKKELASMDGADVSIDGAQDPNWMPVLTVEGGGRAGGPTLSVAMLGDQLKSTSMLHAGGGNSGRVGTGNSNLFGTLNSAQGGSSAAGSRNSSISLLSPSSKTNAARGGSAAGSTSSVMDVKTWLRSHKKPLPKLTYLSTDAAVPFPNAHAPGRLSPIDPIDTEPNEDTHAEAHHPAALKMMSASNNKGALVVNDVAGLHLQPKWKDNSYASLGLRFRAPPAPKGMSPPGNHNTTTAVVPTSTEDAAAPPEPPVTWNGAVVTPVAEENEALTKLALKSVDVTTVRGSTTTSVKKAFAPFPKAAAGGEINPPESPTRLATTQPLPHHLQLTVDDAVTIGPNRSGRSGSLSPMGSTTDDALRRDPSRTTQPPSPNMGPSGAAMIPYRRFDQPPIHVAMDDADDENDDVVEVRPSGNVADIPTSPYDQELDRWKRSHDWLSIVYDVMVLNHLGWEVLKERQVKRLITWLSPWCQRCCLAWERRARKIRDTILAMQEGKFAAWDGSLTRTVHHPQGQLARLAGQIPVGANGKPVLPPRRSAAILIQRSVPFFRDFPVEVLEREVLDPVFDGTRMPNFGFHRFLPPAPAAESPRSATSVAPILSISKHLGDSAGAADVWPSMSFVSSEAPPHSGQSFEASPKSNPSGGGLVSMYSSGQTGRTVPQPPHDIMNFSKGSAMGASFAFRLRGSERKRKAQHKARREQKMQQQSRLHEEEMSRRTQPSMSASAPPNSKLALEVSGASESLAAAIDASDDTGVDVDEHDHEISLCVFKKGEYLYHAEDRSTEAYLILSGCVEMVVIPPRKLRAPGASPSSSALAAVPPGSGDVSPDLMIPLAPPDIMLNDDVLAPTPSNNAHITTAADTTNKLVETPHSTPPGGTTAKGGATSELMNPEQDEAIAVKKMVAEHILPEDTPAIRSLLWPMTYELYQALKLRSSSSSPPVAATDAAPNAAADDAASGGTIRGPTEWKFKSKAKPPPGSRITPAIIVERCFGVSLVGETEALTRSSRQFSAYCASDEVLCIVFSREKLLRWFLKPSVAPTGESGLVESLQKQQQTGEHMERKNTLSLAEAASRTSPLVPAIESPLAGAKAGKMELPTPPSAPLDVTHLFQESIDAPPAPPPLACPGIVLETNTLNAIQKRCDLAALAFPLNIERHLTTFSSLLLECWTVVALKDLIENGFKMRFVEKYEDALGATVRMDDHGIGSRHGASSRARGVAAEGSTDNEEVAVGGSKGPSTILSGGVPTVGTSMVVIVDGVFVLDRQSGSRVLLPPPTRQSSPPSTSLMFGAQHSTTVPPATNFPLVGGHSMSVDFGRSSSGAHGGGHQGGATPIGNTLAPPSSKKASAMLSSTSSIISLFARRRRSSLNADGTSANRSTSSSFIGRGAAAAMEDYMEASRTMDPLVDGHQGYFGATGASPLFPPKQPEVLLYGPYESFVDRYLRNPTQPPPGIVDTAPPRGFGMRDATATVKYPQQQQAGPFSTPQVSQNINSKYSTSPQRAGLTLWGTSQLEPHLQRKPRWDPSVTAAWTRSKKQPLRCGPGHLVNDAVVMVPDPYVEDVAAQLTPMSFLGNGHCGAYLPKQSPSDGGAVDSKTGSSEGFAGRVAGGGSAGVGVSGGGMGNVVWCCTRDDFVAVASRHAVSAIESRVLVNQRRAAAMTKPPVPSEMAIMAAFGITQNLTNNSNNLAMSRVSVDGSDLQSSLNGSARGGGSSQRPSTLGPLPQQLSHRSNMMPYASSPLLPLTPVPPAACLRRDDVLAFMCPAAAIAKWWAQCTKPMVFSTGDCLAREDDLTGVVSTATAMSSPGMQVAGSHSGATGGGSVPMLYVVVSGILRVRPCMKFWAADASGGGDEAAAGAAVVGEQPPKLAKVSSNSGPGARAVRFIDCSEIGGHVIGSTEMALKVDNSLTTVHCSTTCHVWAGRRRDLEQILIDEYPLVWSCLHRQEVIERVRTLAITDRLGELAWEITRPSATGAFR